jgi:hypothetical protein
MTNDSGKLLTMLMGELQGKPVTLVKKPKDQTNCKHDESSLTITKRRWGRVKTIKCECGREYRY